MKDNKCVCVILNRLSWKWAPFHNFKYSNRVPNSLSVAWIFYNSITARPLRKQWQTSEPRLVECINRSPKLDVIAKSYSSWNQRCAGVYARGSTPMKFLGWMPNHPTRLQLSVNTNFVDWMFTSICRSGWFPRPQHTLPYHLNATERSIIVNY